MLQHGLFLADLQGNYASARKILSIPAIADQFQIL